MEATEAQALIVAAQQREALIQGIQGILPGATIPALRATLAGLLQDVGHPDPDAASGVARGSGQPSPGHRQG